MKLKFIISLFLCLFALANVADAKLPVVKQAFIDNNRLKVWYVKDSFLPIISVNIVFTDIGYAYDPKGKEGLAKMVENLLTEGAGDYNAFEFRQKLAQLATSVSFEADSDNFTISLECLKENLPESLSLLATSLFKTHFDNKDIKRIKTQFKTLYAKQEEDPEYIAQKALFAKILENHPYNNPEFGQEETIKKIDKKDLQNYIKNNLSKQNIAISIVGDFDTENLDKLFTPITSLLPNDLKNIANLPEINMDLKGENIYIQKDLPQSIIYFGTKTLKRNDPDFYPGFLLNHVVGGGGFESRLMNNVRKKHGLAYSISTEIISKKYTGLLIGDAATKADSALKSLELIKQELQKVNQQGITKQELTNAQDYLINSFPLRMTKNKNIATFISTMQYQNLGIDFLDKRNDYVNKVTLDAANKMALPYFDIDKMVFVVVGKQGS